MPNSKSSHQVRRQQEIGNALLDGIFVSAVLAHERALCNRRFHEQRVQVLERLRGFALQRLLFLTLLR